MARLDTEFVASEMPTGNTGDFSPLPDGWYSATITAAEVKPTKDGSGQYIKARYDITGPTHQGRVIFANLNIRNRSQKAEEIGRQQMGELMRAVGVDRLADTDQLLGQSVQIKLTTRPARTDEAGNAYEASNEIRGWRSGSGAAPTAAKGSGPFGGGGGAPAAKATTGTAPPWAKK